MSRMSLGIIAVTLLALASPLSADVIHDFPLDSDPGWSTEGLWAFGQPMGGGSHNHDPISGHTGNNVYGYNLLGDYSNNMPTYYLTTTALNCSAYHDVELHFWRWLRVESAQYDHATVEVSNNGSDWLTIWSNPVGAAVMDTAWTLQSFDISSIADHQPTVYVRWSMGTTDLADTYPGWNIDDIQLTGIPEPATLALILFGGIALYRRRRR